MAAPIFRLQAHIATPNFDGERRYIALEKELAHREITAARKRPWLWFRVSALDVYTERDWADYVKRLDHYGRELAKHEQEIRGGLVPIHLRAVNNSSVGDTNVVIRVEAEDGTFKPKKKAPKRPDRMDGVPNNALRHHWRLPAPGGFARKHQKIGGRVMDVTFTHLSAYDSALVVHQVLYVESSAKTRLIYRMHSTHHPEDQEGSIRVPRPNKLS
jgi:hypothetical protein